MHRRWERCLHRSREDIDHEQSDRSRRPRARSQPNTEPCGRRATTRSLPPNSFPRSAPCWCEATGIGPGRPRPRRGRRHRKRGDSRRRDRSERRRQRPGARNCWSTVARLAAERGVELEWREANAHELPFGDNEFDVVMSCIGVMFAPFHQLAADELVRVCKPGGRIGLISWTPEGHIGQLLAAMKPYVPAPPTGAQPPPLWGQEDHVRALLGDRVTDVVTERRMLTRRPLRRRRRVPRLLQDALRADDLGVPQHRGRSGPRGRPRRGHRAGGRQRPEGRRPWNGSTCC